MNIIVHDIPGKLHCGPAALAAITGLHTSAFESLNDFGRCDLVTMREILKQHGFVLDRASGYENGPLSKVSPLSLCIVDPDPGHWVVVESGYLLDCGNRTPTPITSTRFALSETRWCYRVTKL